MSEKILVEQLAGVLTLTLNRPEKKNALDRAMYAELGAAIAGADRDPAARCILIQAEGDAFCAGNDIAVFLGDGAGPPSADEVRDNPLLTALARSATPIVAAVQGRAVGVGATLLLHCDLVVMAEDARLSAPFVDLGLTPEAASSLALVQRIGHARAFAVFALGQAVGADQALDWGLVNAVVPAGELRAAARSLAGQVAARPAVAASLTKRLMRDVEALSARMAAESVHFAAQLRSEEAREALAAFMARRSAKGDGA